MMTTDRPVLRFLAWFVLVYIYVYIDIHTLVYTRFVVNRVPPGSSYLGHLYLAATTKLLTTVAVTTLLLLHYLLRYNY